MIDEPLEEASRRIRDYRADRAAESVLGEAVNSLIDRLINEANSLEHRDPKRVLAAHACGHLHWCRFQALSADDPAAQAEMMAAITIFDQLFQLEPELVPAELHQVFVAAAADPTAGAEGAAAAMSELLGLLQAATNRDQFEKYLTMLRAAPTICPAGHPHHPLAHAYLSIALRIKAERFGNNSDFAEAIHHGRIALTAAPRQHPDRPYCQGALGNALSASYEADDDGAALEEAITVLREAIDTLPAEHPSEATLLNALSGVLIRRAERGDGIEDLDQAITGLRRARNLSTDAQLQVAVRRNLSTALAQRYRQRGDRLDLDEAAELTRDLPELSVTERSNAAGLRAYLNMIIPGMPDQPSEHASADHHASLANDLISRFGDLGDRRDIDGAVSHARRAIELAPDNVRYVVLLGAALNLRSDLYSESADVVSAVEIGRRAVEATPPGHPDRAQALSQLNVALRAKYDGGGREEDLNEAIELGRAAVKQAQTSADRALWQANLGVTLRTRARVTGLAPDLDEAVTTLHAALQALPAGARNRTQVLRVLAGALRDRAATARQSEDLDAAVGYLGEALATTPETSIEWGTCATELSSALRRRYNTHESPDDLELAIALGRQAVRSPAATESGSLHRSGSLARALSDRAEATDSIADLDEAIVLLRRAGKMQGSAYDQAIVMIELGTALWTRHGILNSPEDMAEGDNILRSIIHSDTPASIRISAATAWGSAARSKKDGARSALEAYEHAVRLLPSAAWRGMDQQSREHALNNELGLAGAAAGAAIAAGHAHVGLELLEQCRAVGWTQQLDLRSDIKALAEVSPAVAQRLDAARNALRELELRSTPATHDERIGAAKEWSAAVADAQRLPGGFFKPATANELYRAAAGGPVVVVGIVEPRATALVVNIDGVTVVPLPTTAAEVRDNTIAFLAATHVLGNADLDLRLTLAREEAISEMLGWLWDVVAGPVLQALKFDPISDGHGVWPRLWWCPIGHVSLLPLHAAGHHARRDGTAVLDRVVSSYTPTMRTLITARERVDDLRTDESFLIVAPDPDPSVPPLPAAATEREMIRSLLGDDRHHVLAGPDATVEAVLQQLGQHRQFHLNSHGVQDLFNPSSAQIDLSDGTITLAELARVEMPDGDFAFLSACHTMAGGMSVPDEVMTLASAVQFAGFRHVVGALWAVPDAAAGLLSAKFYQRIVENGQLRSERSAIALHRSILELREDATTLPSLWAPFVHSGP